MGVKWTCALFCLLGIVYLSVEATSSQVSEVKMRNRRALSESDVNEVEAVRTNRMKREAKKSGQGHQHGSSSSSSGNGHGWSTSWSSGSGKGSGNHGRGRRSLSDSDINAFDAVGEGEPINRRKREASPSPKAGHHDGSSSSSSGTGHSWSSSSSWSGNSDHGGRGGGSWGGGRGGNGGGGSGGSWGGSGSGRGYDWRRFVPKVGSYPYYPNYNLDPFDVPSYNSDDFLQQYLKYTYPPSQRFGSRGPRRPENHSWAHAAASMTSPNGGVQPNARTYSYSWSSTPMGSRVESNGGAGHSWQQHNAPNRAVNNEQRYNPHYNPYEYGSPFNNYYPNQFGFGGDNEFGTGFGNFQDYNRGFPNSEDNGFPNSFSRHHGHRPGAHAGASIGTNGGFQSAEIDPAAPGVESRFAQDVSPSSGSSSGTFTYTSSSSDIGPDGKVTHHRTATTGINDNGKVSYHTVHDP